MSRPALIASSQNLRTKLLASPKASRLLLLLAALASMTSLAAAQNFTMQMSNFSPLAIFQGGQAASTITLGVTDNFSDTVALSCSISPAPTGTGGCQVSPATVTPPTGASVTITATGWQPGGYDITITGTSASTGSQTISQRLSVLSVTASFTVTVGTAIAPTSVPAGSSAVGVINVNPINGYTTPSGDSITLACASVTPLVIAPPVCSFTYPGSQNSLSITGPASVPVTLTISTTGPLTTTTQSQPPRGWYAILLPFPFALVGIGAVARGRKTRAWGLITLLLCASSFMLMPACGNSGNPTQTTASQFITPNGTYTFTITAVDNLTGEGASNTTNGSTNSVILTVTTATAQ